MYNRYLRNDEGEYTRVPMPDAPPPRENGHAPPPPPPPNTPPKSESIPRLPHDTAKLFSHLLEKLPLKGIDRGDLLFLTLLFLLFEEKADDELLIALGLLLIL